MCIRRPGVRLGTHLCLVLTLVVIASASATQIDILGPAGSSAFGTAVTVLPNGNIVVTDPYGLASAIGAVYLYDPNGNLLSTLTGSTANDAVGNGGVIVVGNGNFVVLSTSWNNGAATRAGAVTWMNGSTGLGPTAVVSTSNSLVGTTTNDNVGLSGVTVLANGNYVVGSYYWNNSTATQAGAATWGNGSSGISGTVSASNSLVGTTTSDNVGRYVTALNNGNYVVASPYWSNGTSANVGAATWANGASGISGQVSASNSLVGTTSGDKVGNYGIIALSNGNYVVASSYWSDGTSYGAATWGNGASGISGPVSVSNSLIGTRYGNYGGITALANGNYVVASTNWSNGTSGNIGAVTWCNGASGISGPVSASNSLIGVTNNDEVGISGVIALSDGNYMVASMYWNNGNGAVTLANSRFRLKGTIQPWNSVIGMRAMGNLGSTMYATATSYDAARHRLAVDRPLENIVSLFTMDQIFADDFEP